MIYGMNLCIHEIPGTSKKKEKQIAVMEKNQAWGAQ